MAAAATPTVLATAPTCGSAPVTLNAYFETGFPMPKALTDGFTKQYPNVTWNIREDQFAVITQNAPRVLADDPPDLMRLPQVSELVKDGLLKNLDAYAKVFGWDAWPASQLAQIRMGPGGRPRGEGSLYAMGLNFSMTGVFYNKRLAAQIGMSSPPSTLAALDDSLAKAKQAEITPIVQFTGGATGGLAFPLQDLMGAYGPTGPINDWVFQKPGATIDTPSNLQAVQHLDQWIKAGYFVKDANAIDYATMMSRFLGGQGLFMFDGDRESGNLDKQMPGNAGFFLMPPAQQSGTHFAVSSTLIVLGVVPASLLLATLAGFAIGHLRIPGRRLILLTFVLGLTLPFEGIITPLYYQVRDMGLLNTRWAIILPLIGLFVPFSVFWMRAHFVNMPEELSEGARIDGATVWQLFWRIHVSLATPALSSLAILLFLWTWNQFLLAIVLVDDPTKRTVAGAIGAFQGQWGTDIPLLCAGSLLILAPTLGVFLVFQRQFVSSLLQGSLKG